MVAIGGGSQSHNLNDEEARMRKLVKDRKSASRRNRKRATFADVVGDVR